MNHAGLLPWQPMWIGGPLHRLYAALHGEDAAGKASATGIVIAPPLFHEQPRSQRLLTEIASALAAEGVPCLRFDYFGTGDSAGSGEQMDFASMQRDLLHAVNALKKETGVERVGLLAMRGAALAVLGPLQQALAGVVDLFVLWEPIVDGPAWLGELECQDAAERRSPARYPLARGREAVDPDRQLMGYAVSQRMRSDIAGSDLANRPTALQVRCWGVLRPEVATLPVGFERVFELPGEASPIGGGAEMDAALFVGAGLQQMVGALGRAIQEER